MKKRIGIPRALLYYKYYPFFKTFLEGFGFEVLVSPATNEEILQKGVSLCMDEACLPVKVFCGHVAWLKDKVDYVFIYRIASVEKKDFLCSKFWGLTDIARNIFPGCSWLLLNINCNKNPFFLSLFSFGLRFSKNPFKVLKIIREANKKQAEFLRLTEDKKLNVLEAIEQIEQAKPAKKESLSYKTKIAILSHPYNLYDCFINQGILEKLKDMGVEIFTYEMIPKKRLLKECQTFRNIYWTYDREIAGATSFFIKEGIDSIIFIVSFPCGPDSTVIDYLIRKFKDKVPLLNIVIDEHRQDTGLLTRLESFVDIVRMRKK
jgi:predicted nucleotide-binding protein (sugar kinase/HSP70/actin superfamily)